MGGHRCYAHSDAFGDAHRVGRLPIRAIYAERDSQYPDAVPWRCQRGPSRALPDGRSQAGRDLSRR